MYVCARACVRVCACARVCVRVCLYLCMSGQNMHPVSPGAQQVYCRHHHLRDDVVAGVDESDLMLLWGKICRLLLLIMDCWMSLILLQKWVAVLVAVLSLSLSLSISPPPPSLSLSLCDHCINVSLLILPPKSCPPTYLNNEV